MQVEAPTVLPHFVASYCGRLVEGEPGMPFDAGRMCAARAIDRLCGPEAPADVGRGPAGEPLWPAGLTGSITHKDDFFWVAVARTTDALGIGIDAERIIEPDRAGRIARAVMLPREAAAGGDALDAGIRVSLLFSIKEAVFKCLFPLVRKRFYYDALAITRMDVAAGRFEAVLVTGLSPLFPEGHLLSGRIQIDGTRVYSGLWLPHHQPSAGPGDREGA